MNKKSVENIENNLKILYKHCEKAKNINLEKLKNLLEIKNGDIAEIIFVIEDGNVDNEILNFKKEINWEELLENSNYDQKVIRKLLDERDKIMFKSIGNK